MEKEKHYSSIDKKLLETQLKKPEIEIQDSQKKNMGFYKLLVFIPAIGAFIMFCTLLLAVFQFVSQINKERQARLQEQQIMHLERIRNDVDQLIDIGKDKNIPITRSTFLLIDLSSLVKRYPNEIKKVTDILVEFVEHDVDFNNLRDVRLAVNIISYWSEYRNQLKKSPDKVNFILYKYFMALRRIHDEDPQYFESIQYERGFGYRVKYFTEENRYLRFVGLVAGYIRHLELLVDHQNAFDNAIHNFRIAINNSSLSEELFGYQVVVK